MRNLFVSQTRRFALVGTMFLGFMGTITAIVTQMS
jgi:hypothetical protein